MILKCIQTLTITNVVALLSALLSLQRKKACLSFTRTWLIGCERKNADIESVQIMNQPITYNAIVKF